VAEDEIKVEKYLTAEDRARLEEEERKRLEREAKLKGDTVGMRGLTIMMKGELTFKKEKNLLEMEYVREDWMNKPDEEMNDDERQRLKEFVVKEKEFLEKRRKAWEFTLKNIRNEIIDIEYKFEEKFLALNKKRLFYEHRIYEQELYIIRLIIMTHEGRETRASQNKY
jgi:cilia- and flagella-associated protein 43